MLAHDAPFMPPGIGRGRRAVTSTATVTTADQGITIDSTSGTFATNLPTAASAAAGFHVSVYNSGSGTNTITANGAETIRSPSGTATTLALAQGEGVTLSCTGAAWEVILSTGIAASASTPLTVRDNAFTITDEIDTTKTLVFSVGNQATASNFTFNIGSSTASRTLSVPVLTGSDTLLTQNAAGTVTALQSFWDTAIAVVGNVDTTKRIMFQADTQATGATFTIDVGAQTTSRTLNMPVIGGTDTLAALGATNAFTGTTTFVDSVTTIVGNGDATKKIAFEVDAQGSGFTLTVGVGAQTASRQLNIPVIAGTDTLATLAVANVFTNNISQTGTGTFSTGTGTFTHNGSVSIVSGKTLTVSDNTASTTKTTGAETITGGLGVSGRVSAGSAITGLDWTPGASAWTGNGISAGVGATAATQGGILAIEGDGTGGARYGIVSFRGKNCAIGTYGTATSPGDVLGLMVFEGIGSTTGSLRYAGYISFEAQAVAATTVSGRCKIVTNNVGVEVVAILALANGDVTIGGGLTTTSATLHTSATTLTNGAGASVGTLTNAPAAGNPTKWIPIVDNATTRYIPAW